MLEMDGFIAWLEHSAKRRKLEAGNADETLGKWSHRPAQGKPVVRRGRKARGLAKTVRRPSCQIKPRW
jgi:hypothetical protein